MKKINRRSSGPDDDNHVVFSDVQHNIKSNSDTLDIITRDPFGFVHFYSYLLSSLCILLYLIHFLVSLPQVQHNVNVIGFIQSNFLYPSENSYFTLHNRVFYHGIAELFILLIRSINEVKYGRWGILDLFHHLAQCLVTYYLLFTHQSTQLLIASYGWLLCHMQILHLPLAIWYFGCRRGCYSINKTTNKLCCFVFPYTLLFAVSYRAMLMLLNFYLTVSSSKSVNLTDTQQYNNTDNIDNFDFNVYYRITSNISFIVGSLMVYLDYGWTSYFLEQLEAKSQLSTTRTYVVCLIGFVSAAVVSFYL